MSLFEIDFSKLNAMVDGIRKDLPSTIQETLSTLAEIGTSNAKSSRLFKDRTGKLRSSIRFVKNGEASGFVGPVDVPYAGFVEFGNRPGGTGQYIYPRKAKALRFVLNGQIVFRKYVRSHGPLPFMAPARDLVQSFLPDYVTARLERLIARHSK